MSEAQGAESAEAPAAPETPAEAPATPAPDYDRLYERMDQMSAQQQQMAERLGDLFVPTEEEKPEPDYYDDEGQYTDEGVRAVIQSAVDEQIQAYMGPREQQQAVAQRDDDWDALRSEYPELESNRQLATDIIAQAAEWCNAVDPSLIERPQFVDVIERIYKAYLFDQRAEQQQEARPSRVHLESAAGAAQDSKPEVDWQQRIIDAAQRANPQI